MDLRECLAGEFEKRSRRNARYSLRAFARDLGVHHTTVTRIFGRRRRISPHTARLLGQRLGLTDAEIDATQISANAEWLVRFVSHQRFTPNTRALAVFTGMSVDDVNIALHELLYRRQLIMTSPTLWTTNA